jgi:hypothetical protein
VAKSKLHKGETIGNVTSIKRRLTLFEKFTYTELLNERTFMRGEIKRVNRAKNVALKVDPRGMWCEMHEIDKMFREMLQCCETVIKHCEKEMIQRLKEGS